MGHVEAGGSISGKSTTPEVTALPEREALTKIAKIKQGEGTLPTFVSERKLAG